MIIGSRLFYYENLPSTNSFTAARLKEGRLPEGCIIHTNYQPDGRGQGDNKWESEEGKNLLFSVVLYPLTVDAANQFLISMSISLGICDFLDGHATGVSIKWPNDIYVRNDKIAGILIENSVMRDKIEYTIAGIGLNINQKKFISNAPNPVSLSMITGLGYNLSEMLPGVAADLDKRYKQLIRGEYSTVRSEYTARLYRLNEWARYCDTNGYFRGRTREVSQLGYLRIEKEDGALYDYNFGEVDFIL